jgi:hypothetical protein
MDVLRATDFFTSEMWSGFGLLISFLLCFIHFGRQQITTVERILYQWRHAEHSLVLRAFNLHVQGQRWVSWITMCIRSWAIRCDPGLQCIMISTFSPDAERQLRTQDMGKVVCVSAARSRQIRDGPRQRRQQLNILVKDDLRWAA